MGKNDRSGSTVSTKSWHSDESLDNTEQAKNILYNIELERLSSKDPNAESEKDLYPSFAESMTNFKVKLKEVKTITELLVATMETYNEVLSSMGSKVGKTLRSVAESLNNAYDKIEKNTIDKVIQTQVVKSIIAIPQKLNRIEIPKPIKEFFKAVAEKAGKLGKKLGLLKEKQNSEKVIAI